jgi:hypothetical protein
MKKQTDRTSEKLTRSEAMEEMKRRGLELRELLQYRVIRRIETRMWDGIELATEYAISRTYNGNHTHVIVREVIVGLTPESEAEARGPKGRNTTPLRWLRERDNGTNGDVTFSSRRFCNGNGQWTTTSFILNKSYPVTCSHCQKNTAPHILAVLTEDYAPEAEVQS